MVPAARSRTSTMLKLPAMPMGISPLRIWVRVRVVWPMAGSLGPMMPLGWTTQAFRPAWAASSTFWVAMALLRLYQPTTFSSS